MPFGASSNPWVILEIWALNFYYDINYIVNLCAFKLWVTLNWILQISCEYSLYLSCCLNLSCSHIWQLFPFIWKQITRYPVCIVVGTFTIFLISWCGRVNLFDRLFSGLDYIVILTLSFDESPESYLWCLLSSGDSLQLLWY